ncbi:purine catabolism regulatory protein [Paramicrobacterium humi]|uniref:Purine catabolism regulatory protein n=1 Tax=Paramicrobacterium humi TaxID=640635 RepID=A0A1H4JP54_9MICO|nr:PucR family transcriptional regulator [Microbacterium humi]SEB47392.1 purine catabolism regulatory protein [Microbacterium humi]
MAITVRRLLGRTDLGLRLLTAPSEELDAPLSWVAGTDVPDPTPFVGDGNVVLTTGQQFLEKTDETSYAQRLTAAGIRAVGFGVGVVSEVPAALVDACAASGLPLFEVPYRTPFLAVIRYVADLVAAAAQERGAWALGAQRAIALAATQDDGIRRAIAELSRQLGSAVALFDARGRLTVSEGSVEIFGPATTAEVSRLLTRGARAASTSSDGVELQTIGRGGDLRGVLAIAGSLDPAAHGVVAAVLALAAMALEQRRTLGAAEAALRGATWQALVHGSRDLAERLAAKAGARIPASFRVGIFKTGDAPAAETAGDLFAAIDGDSTIVLSSDADWARVLHAQSGAPVGLSRLVPSAAAAEGLRQARLAHDRACRLGTITEFDAVADDGYASMLRGDDARAIGAEVLRPLTESDAAHGTQLIASLRAWLAHNGAWDPAAESLGVHRHTLRNRVRAVERLTGRDLGSARVRADFIFALDL